MSTVIIDYGAGNVFSVAYALERLGYKAQLSDDKQVIAAADKVIFPGVGSAGSAMDFLQKKGLDQFIPQLQQPILGICLGLQLMGQHSEEKDTKCLGIFDSDILHFPKGLKTPQMGWNKITDLKGPLFHGLKDGMYAYFVHSYYAPYSEKHTIATSDYGVPFSAAIQKDNFYACQFHPEKSGNDGQKILKNFMLIRG